MRRYIAILLLALLALLPLIPARGQEPGGLDLTAEELAGLGEAAGPVKDLRPQKNKVVYLILDVSGSMKGFKMWTRARQAAADIIRYGCSVGDEVGLLTFGSGYDTFVRKIETGDDKAALLDKLPKQVSEGAGTNIRRPHHEALKAISERSGRPAYIVVFTDSYNDEPKPDDPTYTDYKNYYTPGGQLTKYPKTAENRAYERLLSDLVVDGKVKQYGIGIDFAPDGRPIERLPKAEATPVPVPASTPDPEATVSKPEEKTSPLVWVALGLVGLAMVGGLVFFMGSPKPMALRIHNGPKEAKDFQVRGNQPIRIGGEGAKFAPDAFPIAELKTPIAVIRPGRGGLLIVPYSDKPTNTKGPETPAPVSNESPKVRVSINGLPLEAEHPVGYGDEIRLSIAAATAAGMAKEYRLKLSDPKQI